MNIKGFTFAQKLTFSVIVLFLSFSVAFILFQYKREKHFKIRLLTSELSFLCDKAAFRAKSGTYVFSDSLSPGIRNLRFSILNESGKVLYDNAVTDISSLSSHLKRKEVVEALRHGEGYDIKRHSETVNSLFFYYAKYYPHDRMIVRMAIPYEFGLMKMLSADKTYAIFAFFLVCILIFIYVVFISKMDKTITSLKIFAAKAERGEHDLKVSFPKDELGEIAGNIVNLYYKLHKSESDKDRIKRQLTHNIAHELKTPVSSIRGFLETLISDPEMPSGMRDDFIRRSHSQCVRLSNLLRDISLLTKMDENAIALNFEPINLHLLVDEVASDSAHALKAGNMKFFNLVDPGCVISGDYNLLYSVFRNLTDNSVAYAGTGASITVNSSVSEPGYVNLSFEDNGEGVGEEHLEHIFERFYRADKGRSRLSGGTGLGLSIVKNAVISHGGTITASIAETNGLRFDFKLKR